MEYKVTGNYCGSGVRIARSLYKSENGGASELHAILSLPEVAGLTPVEQLNRLGSAARALAAELSPEGICPVMARWLLSDAANLAPLLPAISSSPIAVSVIGQSPLDGAHASLWIYFMPADPKRIDAHSVSVSRHNRSHIFTASALATMHDSYTTTAELLNNYQHQLELLGTSIASGCLRTWFFVRDIDFFYSGMVRARNEMFARLGLTADTHFIASTGIEGKPERHDITVKMDAWTVAGLQEEQITYIKAPTHLNSTHEYGVAFERATAIDYSDRRHLLISGTASIDSKGNIVCPGDIEGQTRRMLENVGALLDQAGMQWSDMAHIIIYLRDIAHRTIVAAIFESMFPEASSAPRVLVQAPVCRPGWLIEMECMAITPAANPQYAPF